MLIIIFDSETKCAALENLVEHVPFNHEKKKSVCHLNKQNLHWLTGKGPISAENVQVECYMQSGSLALSSSNICITQIKFGENGSLMQRSKFIVNERKGIFIFNNDII